MHRSLATLSLVLSLSACSTQPVATDAATPVPKDRILSEAYSKPVQGGGTLVVKRDTGLVGSGCNWIVSVNGSDQAVMASGEIFAAYLPAGEAIVSARPRATLCPGGSMETGVMIVPGKVKSVRISLDAWTGTARLQSTAY